MKAKKYLGCARICVLLGLSGAAHAQSHLNIYGILDASVSHAKAVDTRTALRSGDLLAPRLGIKGSESLGGNTRVHFALEAGLALDVGTGSASNVNNQASGGTAAGPLTFNRQSWVGLEGHWGELRLGRNFNPNYRQYIAYDPFMGGGIGASQAAQSSLAVYGHSPSGLRHSNAIEYWLPSKTPLTGQFMYAKGENGPSQPNASDGNYLAARLAYQFDDINFGIAHGRMKNAAKEDIDESVLGARWRLGSTNLMGMYTRSKEGIGTYQNGWLVGATSRHQAMEYRMSLSSSRTKAPGGRIAGQSHKLAAVAAYHFSRRSAVYVASAWTHNSKGAAMVPLGTLNAADTTPNQAARAISLGLTHTF